MVDDAYQYMLDFFREDGAAAGQVVVTPDWLPALESVHFEGIRQGRLPAVTAVGPSVVAPVWHAKAGAPYVSGVRVAVAANKADGATVSRDFPTRYFRGLATQASATLVEKGALKAGDAFRYLVSAFSKQADASSSAPGNDFAVEEIAQPLPLAEGALDKYLHDAAPSGSFEPGVDAPVFLPQHVIDEATALAEAAGDIETGGVLVGNLRRAVGAPVVNDDDLEIGRQFRGRFDRANHHAGDGAAVVVRREKDTQTRGFCGGRG